jgi:hypothetical protein
MQRSLSLHARGPTAPLRRAPRVGPNVGAGTVWRKRHGSGLPPPSLSDGRGRPIHTCRPQRHRRYSRAAVLPADGFSVRSKKAQTRFHESICSGESSRSSVCRFTRRLNVCPTLTGPGVGLT